MTKVYGASDDLIEFDGDVRGEVGCSGTDDEEHSGALLVFSDGTLLCVKYGKLGRGIWGVTLVQRRRQQSRFCSWRQSGSRSSSRPPKGPTMADPIEQKARDLGGDDGSV